MTRGLERTLSLKTTIMIGLASTIGSGIFVLVPAAMKYTGPSILFTLLVTSVLTFATAGTYAELSELLPFAGGGYFFVKKSFKGFIPFLAGWFSWFGNMAYATLSALVFGHAVSLFVNMDPLAISIFTIFLFTAVNMFGSKETGETEIFLTAILIIILTFFTVTGLISGKSDFSKLSPFFRGGLGSSIYAIGLIYPLFIGFEIIAVISEEIKEPEKNIHRAIFSTLSIATVLYLVVSFVLVLTMSYAEITHSSTLLQDAAGKILGPWGVFLMGAGAIFASLTSLNSTILASSRVCFALARDRYIPHILSKIDSKFNTPTYAVLVSSTIITLLALLPDLEFLGNLSSFGFLFLLIFVNLSLIKLRKHEKKLKEIKRHYEVPFFPWTPLVGAFFSFVFLLTVERASMAFGIAMTIVGIIIYYMEFKVYPEIKKIKAPWERKEEKHVLHPSGR